MLGEAQESLLLRTHCFGKSREAECASSSRDIYSLVSVEGGLLSIMVCLPIELPEIIHVLLIYRVYGMEPRDIGESRQTVSFFLKDGP